MWVWWVCAIVPPWVFPESKIFSSGNFVAPKLFLVGILSVQKFFLFHSSFWPPVLFYLWQSCVDNTAACGKHDTWELEVRGVFWMLSVLDIELARNWRNWKSFFKEVNKEVNNQWNNRASCFVITICCYYEWRNPEEKRWIKLQLVQMKAG